MQALKNKVAANTLAVNGMEAAMTKLVNKYEAMNVAVEGMSSIIHGNRDAPIVTFPLETWKDVDELTVKLKKKENVHFLVILLTNDCSFNLTIFFTPADSNKSTFINNLQSILLQKQALLKPRSEDREKAFRRHFTDEVLAGYNKTGSGDKRSYRTCPIFRAMKSKCFKRVIKLRIEFNSNS